MQQEVSRVPDSPVVGASSSLVEALHRNVERFPGKTALVKKSGGKWRTLSYAELYARVERFAAGLAGLGVGEGSRVALMSKNRPKWAISDFAVQSLRAALVPVYPTLEPGQVAHILKDSGSRILIVEDAELLERVRSVRDAVPELRSTIVMDDSFTDVEEGVLRFGGVETAGEESPLEGWEAGWRGISREDVATIIYTSGTTGLPKGVVLTQGNLLSNVEGTLESLPVRGDDTFLSFLPLSHVFERTSGQFLALSLGATTYYAESIEKVPENLREVKPTLMLSVPRLYEKVYDRVTQQVSSGPALRRRLFWSAIADGKRRYEIEKKGGKVGRVLETRLKLWDRLVFGKLREAVGGRVRFFVAGGAKLNADIGQFFHAAGIKIVEGYGLTETSPTISCNRLEKMRFGTVGPPLGNVEVRISGDGEILVRGPGVMRGYLDNEEATAEVFTEEGFFRTGDIGEFDEAGYLRVTDRAKNLMVLSTGKNVAPQPIEVALAAAQHISQAVLLGDGRKYVSALVVPDYETVRKTLATDAPDEELAEDDRVRELVQEDIEAATEEFVSYERPKRFALLPRELNQEAGELTPTLKVRLGPVKERYGEVIEKLYE